MNAWHSLDAPPMSLDLPAGAHLTLACDPRDADALFAALCGLEAVPPGTIAMSGLCLTDLSRGSLRRAVFPLQSRPLVLQGSLRRNLALGLTERPSDTKLIRAANNAGLGRLLDRNGGLGGTIAEGGCDLSSRERSALSLARMALGKPKLVLLGEAVWHLDKDARDALTALLDQCGATVLRHPVLAAGT